MKNRIRLFITSIVLSAVLVSLISINTQGNPIDTVDSELIFDSTEALKSKLIGDVVKENIYQRALNPGDKEVPKSVTNVDLSDLIEEDLAKKRML